MVVTVYVWLQRGQNVGHGSLALSDGTYISWWPSEDKNKTAVAFHWKSIDASTSPSYSEDKEAEGHDADSRITIERLDEAAIRRWWAQFSDVSKYHILGNNCCTVVFKALKEGGAENFVKFPVQMVATPAGLNSYATKLQQATK